MPPALPHRLSQNLNAHTSPRDRAVAHIELGVAVILYTWPALRLAVQNTWGGPQSGAKRDWLCETVPGVLLDAEDVDDGYVEELLMQVMDDEFEVVIDDNSIEEVSKAIVKVFKDCLRGEFEGVKTLFEKWVEKEGSSVNAVEGKGDTDDEDDDDDDDDDDDQNDQKNDKSRPPRQKPEPEIDQDGFTTVVKGKK